MEIESLDHQVSKRLISKLMQHTHRYTHVCTCTHTSFAGRECFQSESTSSVVAIVTQVKEEDSFTNKTQW